MRRVSELTSEPEVGKFYLVPCVKVASGDWIPIVGTLHEDKEHIGFEEYHYHRDARFTSDKQNRRSTPDNMLDPEIYSMVVAVIRTEPPVEKARKCRRRMPDFPLRARFNEHPPRAFGAKWFPTLERAYSKTKASCARCPHRGMLLNNLPVKDGVVVCNGHGLAWDVETGKLVSRLK